jgi:SpoVK/Ycf46/Vps4 family AAA+-type ATPase
MLLVGPPGNGKTSLARGLASQIARVFKSDGHFGFIEVEPHSTTSALHGKTQQAVLGLLSTISEVASHHPVIVLLDEVETLAPSRARMSMETNPVDVHRATDAVLAQIDHLAAKHTNLLFIATSNFAEAVDSAFLSRADIIEQIDPPNGEGRRFIIKDTLEELGRVFPEINKLITTDHLNKLAEMSDGLDGRRLRKAVVNACASDKQTAANISRLTFVQLHSSFKKTASTKISFK